MRTGLPAPKVTYHLFDAEKKRFKNLKKLGQGAFGAAFSAKLNGKKVIVKTAVGTPGLVSRKEAAESMEREVKILTRLQKFPFVPRLIEVGLDYFVQEDTEGVSLLNLLAKKGLEPRELLSSIVSGGVILSKLHQAGVAHNDFEPRNILHGPDGVVAIDFGISVLAEEDPERFREALNRDIESLLESVILVLSERKLPNSTKIMLASTVEKFRKIVMSRRADENTADELAKELLFALSQLGARAARDRSIERPKVKVVVV
ncbi:MAG: protein kinase [Gemmatimonadales bacterium]|nr:protein kinase [Gemmatimonadales bacterium]